MDSFWAHRLDESVLIADCIVDGWMLEHHGEVELQESYNNQPQWIESEVRGGVNKYLNLKTSSNNLSEVSSYILTQN